MSAIPPLLEGKRTLGEQPENDAHDPKLTPAIGDALGAVADQGQSVLDDSS